MSDRLSPILVKELRQGLRARAFESSFVLLQVVLVLVLVVSLMAASRDKPEVVRIFGSAWFWTVVAVPLVLVMPLRGAFALQNEVRLGALDLIFLTRLTAWRIVVGKWAALFAQSCLLLCAVLPYGVLRYYLGSVDLVGDFEVVLGLLGISALFTAFNVTVSAYPSRLARVLVFLAPVLLLWVIPVLWAVTAAIGGGPGRGLRFTIAGGTAWVTAGLLLLYGLLALAYILQVGAARIAPAAENHALPKRVLGLGLLALGPVVVQAGADNQVLAFNLALLAPVCVDALCANPLPVPGQLRVFARRRWLGGWAAWIFAPGWVSGALYVLVLLGATLALFAARGMLSHHLMTAWLGLGGTLFVPLALVVGLRRRVRGVGRAYAAALLSLVVGSGVFLLLNAVLDADLGFVSAVLPPAAVVMAMARESNPSWVPAGAALFAASVGVAALAGRRDIARHRRLWREALDRFAGRPEPGPGEAA